MRLIVDGSSQNSWIGRRLGGRYEILDLINLHYCLSRRSDTDFWREVRKPERVNDRLQAKLDYWRLKPPSPADFEDPVFPGQAAAQSFDPEAPVDTACMEAPVNQ